MKKKFNPFAGLCLALLVLVSACNNSDDDDPSPGGGGSQDCVITEMKEGNNTTTFTYTNDQLSKASFDSAGTANDNYFTFERNQAGQITKANQFDGSNATTGYIAYEYTTDGLVSKANYFTVQGSSTTPINALSITSEYTNKVLSKTTTYFNLATLGIPIQATIPVSYTSYTSSNGNITKTMNYSLDPLFIQELLQDFDPTSIPTTAEFMNNMVLDGSTEYQFDDKKNPAQPLGFLFQDASTVSTNNITVKVDKDDTGATTNTTNNVYEYNSDGYPTKVTSTETGNAAEVTTLSYKCD
ncbi:hypothetical protein [Adhaeribacter radiodurans]|uniref:DUF4595 domain-containing protein n=1 Tax=Adhaeribacter radiodurans TaxID=2745197 RepID=A0A7L7L6W2_9BACT|nr:hypothetical protein [Adhaeribacter radiodurans]QMU28582.1 hypothetical protein HUW48_11265 [Adhaeribacter radiodurans]